MMCTRSVVLILINRRLYTAQGYESIEELKEIFQHRPEEVEFYLPQLAVLLVYGSFEALSELQGAVLQMCQSSVHFSHRYVCDISREYLFERGGFFSLHWFINSFCLSGAGVTEEGITALRQFLEMIEVWTHGILREVLCC